MGASDRYKVQCIDKIAGQPFTISSRAALEDAELRSTLSLAENNGQYFISGQSGKVRYVAATDTLPEYATRVYIAIRDRRNKRLKIARAAGDQIVRLEARLANVPYDDDGTSHAGVDRVTATNDLIAQFGSARRARQREQQAEARVENLHTISPEGMAAAVIEMGKKAEQEGYTSKQILEQVSDGLCLPAHDPTATTAEGAYRISRILTKAQSRHLEVSYLKACIADAESPAYSSMAHKQRCDAFVSAVLRPRQAAANSGAHGGEDVTRTCRWLALYNNCRKVLRVPPGTRITAPANLPGNGEGGGGGARAKSMQDIVAAYGFFDEAAAECFLGFLGSLDLTEHGDQVFRVTSTQERRMKLLLVVSALRSNGSRLSADLVDALMDGVRAARITAVQLRALFKETGCIVKSEGTSSSGPRFSVSLLSGTNSGKTLKACLPAVKRRRSRKART